VNHTRHLVLLGQRNAGVGATLGWTCNLKGEMMNLIKKNWDTSSKTFVWKTDEMGR
jgi:hypothetical protein